MTQPGLGDDFAPASILAALPPLRSGERSGVPLDDRPLLVKWFSPYNQWTWYATEHTDGICFGFVDGFEGEWGTFDLNELASVKISARQMFGGALTGESIESIDTSVRVPAVERDCYWEPVTLRELRARNEIRSEHGSWSL